LRKRVTIYLDNNEAEELERVREYISQTKAVELCLTKPTTLKALRKRLSRMSEFSGEKRGSRDGKE
jgi:hypothetical protein